MTPFERYAAARRESGPARALRQLRRDLEPAPAADWCRCAEQLAADGEADAALVLIDSAASRFPASPELAAVRARVWSQRPAAPATPTLAPAPAPAGALAEAVALRERGALRAAAAAAERSLAGDLRDADAVVRCALFQRDCDQSQTAFELCERALAGGVRDASLEALGGQLALALGRFDAARRHLEAALDQGADLSVWLLASGLADAQKYRDATHPDFARFAAMLERPGLSPSARASVLFALGKAYDDVGDFERAARQFREANALARGVMPWSRERWNQWIARQLAWPPLRPAPRTLPFTPVFIVGMPRSGTTLAAEILGRHPEVRNRGELFLLRSLHEQLAPGPGQDAAIVAAAQDRYEAQLCRDDAPARWYIDKNPMNFRYLPVAQALAPQSRVIWCRRSARDTALSIWKKFFAGDTGYAHDFEAIADVLRDSERLMAHWSRTLQLPVYALEYERLVNAPGEVVPELAAFLGLPVTGDLLSAPSPAGAGIATASRWQARQPIHKGALGTWRSYAPYVPELERLFGS